MNGKQLKNSILQWAIQGKLVPQDPNDEPASVLLERIRAEKARLVKEGKIKKDKNESIIFRGEDNSHYEKFADGRIACIDDEIPFEVPSGWEWARLKNLVYNHGQTIPKHPFSYIDIGSINNTDLRLNERENIIQAKDAPSRARRIVEFGDILYSTVRPYLHNMCIVDRVFSAKPIASTGLAVMACYPGLINQFLFLYLQSHQFDQYANDGDNSKGVAYPAINDDKLYKALIPVPPANEQSKIVEIISTLQPLLRHYSLSQSKIDELNRSIKPLLQKSFLQEAIQGKLVPQNSNEEAATVLLERIRAESKKLLKEGKLKKKDIVDSVIYKGEDNKYYEKIDGKTLDISEEIPFDLPESWCWCRFASIVHYRIGKTPARGETAYWEPGTIPWVSISDMKDYGTVAHTKESVSPKAATLLGQKSPRGTLLMSFKLTVGRTAVLDIDAYHNEAIISIWPFWDSSSLQPYLFYTLPVLANLGDSKDAIKGKTLNTSSINNLLIPLPPSAEQMRIVNRIKELYRHL